MFLFIVFERFKYREARNIMGKNRLGENGLGYLSRYELARLLRKIKARDNEFYHLVYIAYLHGLRVSEVLQLKATDYNLSEKKVVIRRLKGSLTTIQPANEVELNYVRLSKSNRLFHMSRATVDRKFKNYCSMSNIEKNRSYIHILKHSCAVHLLQSGSDLYTIKKTLGHKDLKSTLVYLKYVDKNIDKAIMLLEQGLLSRGLK